MSAHTGDVAPVNERSLMRKIDKTVLAMYVASVVIAGGSYGVNMYKLVQCDFESPYVSEVIHVSGVIIPPISLVTAWFDTDGDIDSINSDGDI